MRCDDRDPSLCSNRTKDRPCSCPCHAPQEALPEAVREHLVALMGAGKTDEVAHFMRTHPQYIEAFVPLLTNYLNGGFGNAPLSPGDVYKLLNDMGIMPTARIVILPPTPTPPGMGGMDMTTIPFQKGEKLH